MLWPIVTPAVLTFWTLAALVLLATLIAPQLAAKQSRMFAWGCLLAPILFVPSCTAVMMAMNRYRFGVFQYENCAAVQDPRIAYYFPPAASDITVEKKATGYRAKFTIDAEALEEWFQQVHRQDVDHTVESSLREEHSVISREDFEVVFGDLGWSAPTDAMEYIGPWARNGAGFTIWYSPAEQIGYQEVGYW